MCQFVLCMGKVRELETFITFDSMFTHNFISHELPLKLGIHEFDMGDVILANEAFKGERFQSLPL